MLAKARALEAQGKHVIHLEIGQPDFPTPPHVVEAGKKALDEGWTKYGPTPGFPDLRDAIAAEIVRTRGMKVGADNVCVVPGRKRLEQHRRHTVTRSIHCSPLPLAGGAAKG